MTLQATCERSEGGEYGVARRGGGDGQHDGEWLKDVARRGGGGGRDIEGMCGGDVGGGGREASLNETRGLKQGRVRGKQAGGNGTSGIGGEGSEAAVSSAAAALAGVAPAAAAAAAASDDSADLQAAGESVEERGCGEEVKAGGSVGGVDYAEEEGERVAVGGGRLRRGVPKEIGVYGTRAEDLPTEGQAAQGAAAPAEFEAAARAMGAAPAAAPADAGPGVRVLEAEAERRGLEVVMPEAALTGARAERLAGSATAVRPAEAEGSVIGREGMGGDAGVEAEPAEPVDASAAPCAECCDA